MTEWSHTLVRHLQRLDIASGVDCIFYSRLPFGELSDLVQDVLVTSEERVGRSKRFGEVQSGLNEVDRDDGGDVESCRG